MEDAKIKRWVKIIAGWTLIGTIIGTIFYVLIYLSIVEEELTVIDKIDSYVIPFLGLSIFWGLWNFKSWGWKLIVISTPLTWVFYLLDLLLNFQPNLGFVYSIFIFIDVAILHFLFKPEVKDLFGIQNWSKLKWVITPLWLSGSFLAVNYIFGDLVAFFFCVSLFLGLKTAKKYSVETTNLK